MKRRTSDLIEALIEHRGNIYAAADDLGMDAANLRKAMRRRGIARTWSKTGVLTLSRRTVLTCR